MPSLVAVSIPAEVVAERSRGSRSRPVEKYELLEMSADTALQAAQCATRMLEMALQEIRRLREAESAFPWPLRTVDRLGPSLD